MNSQQTLAVVIPALDEEGIIGRVVAEMAAAVPATMAARVIVVDNGSTDRTAAEAGAAGATVVSEPNRGYGRACLAGLVAAVGAEFIVFADGDGADDPVGLSSLLAPLLAGTADLIVGVRVAERRERGAMTIQQRVGNVVASQLIGRLYGTPVSDLGPFRAIRRDRLLALGMTDMTYGWSTEMLVKSLRFGYRYREVPVGYRRRGAGYSKVGGNLGAGLKAGVAIFATALRHTARPLPSTTRRLEDRG